MSIPQYDQNNLAEKYTNKNQEHPIEKAIYSTWLRECGQLSHHDYILDVGCGSGYSTRLLAKKFACSLTAFDESANEIKIAREKERTNPLGICYLKINLALKEIPTKLGSFHTLITAAYVLHYANSKQLLDDFIKNISLCLAPKNKFIAINADPNNRIQQQKIFHNKKLLAYPFSTKCLDVPLREGSKILIHLYNKEGKEICNFINYHWSKKTYEAIFQKYGLINIKWIEPRLTEEDAKKYPEWIGATSTVLIISAEKGE